MKKKETVFSESELNAFQDDFNSLLEGEELIEETILILNYQIGNINKLILNYSKSDDIEEQTAYLAYIRSEIMDVIAQVAIITIQCEGNFLSLLRSGLAKVLYTIEERKRLRMAPH